MSLWTWILIGLCAAGVFLALISAIAVVLEVLRVRARLIEIMNSRLILSIGSLQSHLERLARSARGLDAIRARVAVAIESIQGSVRESGLAQWRETLRQAVADSKALIEDLR